MIAILRWDIVGVMYFILAGICSVLTYGNAYTDPYRTQNDEAYLIFGSALIFSAMIEATTLVMHRKWIKRQIQTERNRMIQRALAQPLLHAQAQNSSFQAMPANNGGSVYMGEPIMTDQNNPQNQYNPTLPTYSQPRGYWFVKFLDL